VFQRLIITVIFISSTLAVTAKFIPYVYFYKYNAGDNVQARVFLASNYEGPPNVDSTDKTTEEIKRERRELIGQKLASVGFDRENVIILEEPSPISPQFGQSNLDIIAYSAEHAVFKTRSAQPKLLFLADPYYNGWRAKVDGEEVKVLRANYSYRAIAITGGEHLVEFYFDPWWFKAAVVLSTVSLIVLVFFLPNARSAIRNL